MARSINLTPRAAEEIDGACEWYESREPGLEDRFLRALGHAFELIASRPELYPIRFASIRRIILKKFPYAVYYHYDDEEVVIDSVFHEARDSSRLKNL